MASFDLTCPGCTKRFKAKSARAKWCSSACSKRAARAKKRAAEVEAIRDKETEESELEIRVRERLGAAGKLGTFEGQLALECAKRAAKAGAQGFASLSRELRVLVAAALGEKPLDATSADLDDDSDATPEADPGIAVVNEIEAKANAKRAAAAAAS